MLTFSCLEGLVKETLIFIKEKCGKCDKTKECEYYPGKNIKNLPFINALEKLFNMRIICIYEHELIDYDFIKELRNNIHIINIKENNDINDYYIYDNVDLTISFYIELLDQINMYMNFYKENNYSCLKDLDLDGIKFTKQDWIQNKISSTISNLFNIDILNKEYEQCNLFERLVIKNANKLFNNDKFIFEFNKMINFKLYSYNHFDDNEKNVKIDRLLRTFKNNKNIKISREYKID